MSIITDAVSWFAKNGYTILSVIGDVSGIAAPFLAIKADRDAKEIIENAEDLDLTNKKEVIKRVWPAYIPPVTAEIISVGCNIIAKRTYKNLAINSTLGYCEKRIINEKLQAGAIAALGVDSLQKIESKIKENTTIPEQTDKTELFWDSYQKKYFYAEKADVLEAINRYANLYNKRGYVSINDFYKILGNPGISQIACGAVEGYNSGSEYCDSNGIDGTDLLTIRKVTLEDVPDHYELTFLWDPLYDYMSEEDLPM